MTSLSTRTYVISADDYLSRTFSEHILEFVPLVDGRNLNALSKVSRFFFDLINDALMWSMKARQLELDYLNARQEVRVFTEMDSSQRRTYRFVKSVIGSILPTEFKKIPYIGLVKSQKILVNWPLDAPMIAGIKYETYLHTYVPYIAFCVTDRSFYGDQKRIILVIEKTTFVTGSLKEYLIRLFKGDPCGSWENGVEKLPKIKRGKSIIAISPPPNNDYINLFSHTFVPMGY